MSAQNIYDLTDTWNEGSTIFNAIKMNVTDTASNSASLLIDLQRGGVSQFNVRRDGRVTTREIYPAADNTHTLGDNSLYWGGVFSTNVTLKDAGALGWQNQDLYLRRDAANTLAQRNGTNAQAFRVYNTFTDASNYERLEVSWASNVLSIGPTAAGTGAVRSMQFSSGGTGRWTLNTSGHILANADNTYDIGAGGANRPRDVWVGRNVTSSGYVHPSYLRLDDSNGVNGVRLYRAGTGILTLYNTSENSFDRLQFGGTTSSFPAIKRSGAALEARLADDSNFCNFTALTITGSDQIVSASSLVAHSGTAIPAGGTAGAGVRVSSAANFGVFFGSGAPTLSAAKGSLYLRSDGSTTNNRMYVNTDGATTWTAVTTAA